MSYKSIYTCDFCGGKEESQYGSPVLWRDVSLGINRDFYNFNLCPKCVENNPNFGLEKNNSNIFKALYRKFAKK